jgi:predicted nucleic acid-binding protein
MSYLFDTDAISELLRPTPVPACLRWLGRVPRAEPYMSAVVVGELMKGAWRSPRREHHLGMLEERVLPMVTILPFDAAVARVYGRILDELERSGRGIPGLFDPRAHGRLPGPRGPDLDLDHQGDGCGYRASRANRQDGRSGRGSRLL